MSTYHFSVYAILCVAKFFTLSNRFALIYRNNGNVNAIAIRNVKGIRSHQNFILSLRLSEIINTKKVMTTTDKSAARDFPAKLTCASFMKFENVGSSTA